MPLRVALVRDRPLFATVVPRPEGRFLLRRRPAAQPGRVGQRHGCRRLPPADQHGAVHYRLAKATPWVGVHLKNDNGVAGVALCES